jgi:DNA-binding GntR family transcriptional regulator
MIAAPTSRTDWAIECIRRAILFGDAVPGERLVSSTWSARLGISQTPLREAFQRLAAEGFVDYDPQRGARVAPLTQRDAVEIYEVRIVLEPRAVSESVEAATDAWRAELREAFERIDAVYASGDELQSGAVEAHREFHRVVRACCPSAWLLRITAMLADQSTRMQFASLSARGGNRQARAEHRDIYEAAQAGDARAAGALCGAHLQRTLDALKRDSAA